MKKYSVELAVILVISFGVSLLLPGYMRGSDSIISTSISELIITTLMLFTVLSLAYFAFSKKRIKHK